MPDPRRSISGSERTAPSGSLVGDADPSERVEVSIYFKDEASAAPSRQAYRAARAERLQSCFSDLTRFAAEHGLDVTLQHPARRLIKLAGPVAKLEVAFG